MQRPGRCRLTIGLQFSVQGIFWTALSAIVFRVAHKASYMIAVFCLDVSVRCSSRARQSTVFDTCAIHSNEIYVAVVHVDLFDILNVSEGRFFSVLGFPADAPWVRIGDTASLASFKKFFRRTTTWSGSKS